MSTTDNMIHPLESNLPRPERFTFPFCYEPHPLALLAASAVQRQLQTMTLGEGKMFGVLVVERSDGSLAFLAAYSGLLEGRNDWPWFVPPIYDAQQPDGHFKQVERQLSRINEELAVAGLDADAQSQLRERRHQLSMELQQWLFQQYRLLNARGEQRDLVAVWQDYHCSARLRRRYPLPPGGTGDCCAPKLLQAAYRLGLRPLCMAEFWWGPSPRSDVRHHGQFYPACRGKCKPVLTWMLQGLDVDADPDLPSHSRLGIDVVYEDEALLVVSKPSGLLSVPGRTTDHSVATLVAAMRPGALLAHRLDMGTSGLMVAGKTLEAYHALQRQFVEHKVRKRYVALLDGVPRRPMSGEIRLPLLHDPINRPRQMVDFDHGKTAVTRYELLASGVPGGENPPARTAATAAGGYTLVALYPLTGRTHQLRLHCAHAEGLGCPIVGDELYGSSSCRRVSPAEVAALGGENAPTQPYGDRLCLHAEELWLYHPVSGEPLHFVLPHPFGNHARANNK